tara:strand:- start:401 stop:604 length:204 start_codon:yes stop_codon:yes gene_type:complete
MDKDKIRKLYEYAQKNKGEDRVTKADLEDAKKALGFKDAVPEIGDYMSGGGEVEVGKGKDYIKDLID